MATEDQRKCRFCGKDDVHGPGCLYSDNGMHEAVGEPDTCVWCGSTSYGPGCLYSEDGLHMHGHGDHKCIYCGSDDGPGSCLYSPDGKHHF